MTSSLPPKPPPTSRFQFYTPYTEHAFLEPECAVAFPDGDGVMILSTDQGAYDTQHETAPMLGLPMEKVKVKYSTSTSFLASSRIS